MHRFSSFADVQSPPLLTYQEFVASTRFEGAKVSGPHSEAVVVVVLTSNGLPVCVPIRLWQPQDLIEAAANCFRTAKHHVERSMQLQPEDEAVMAHLRTLKKVISALSTIVLQLPVLLLQFSFPSLQIAIANGVSMAQIQQGKLLTKPPKNGMEMTNDLHPSLPVVKLEDIVPR